MGLALVLIALQGCSAASTVGQSTPQEGAGLERIAQLGGYQATPLAAVGRHAYVGDGTTLVTVDITDPTRIRRVSVMDLPDVATDIAGGPGHAVVAVGAAGVVLVDLTDPAQPKLAARWSSQGPANKVLLEDDRAIVLSGDVDEMAVDGAATLSTIDISDLSFPRPVGSTAVSGMGIDMVSSGQWVYVITTRSQGSLVVYELADEGRPEVVGVLQLNGCRRCPFDMTADGDYVVYVSENWEAGVQVVDVREPRRMTVVGSLPLPESSSWIKDVKVVGAAVYVLCNDALCVFDISKRAQPRLLQEIAQLGGERLVSVGTELVVKGSAGLRLVDTQADGAPRLSGTMNWFNNGNGPVVLNDKFLLVTENSTLWLFDVTNPRRPQVLNHVNLEPTNGSIATALAMDGNLVFVGLETAFGGSVAIVDVSDPARPKVMAPASQRNVSNKPVSLNRYGRYLYVFEEYGELERHTVLEIVDINDLSAPRRVKTLEAAGEPRVMDTHLIVAEDRALTVYSLEDPLLPREIGRTGVAGLHDLHVVAPFAYLRAGASGSDLVVIDLSAIDRPRLIGRLRAACDRLQSVADGRAYCGQGRTGVQVFDVGQADTPRRMPDASWPAEDLRDATEIQTIDAFGPYVAVSLREPGPPEGGDSPVLLPFAIGTGRSVPLGE
jgi:hypothetical protein